MKTYKIFNKQELEDSLADLKNLYGMASRIRGKESKITVKVTRYRKPKSSAQHRAYFAALSQLKLAFRSSGIEVNEDDLHQYIKYKAGLTKVFEGVTVVRSIADLSEDATSKNLNFLIDFIVRFAAQELNYSINIGDSDEFSD